LSFSRPYQQKAYPKYNRIKKKFPPFFREKLNEAEDKVAIDPSIGEQKTGGLRGIRVYKFNLFDQEILLAYELDKNNKEVIFVAVGGHENFYKDLKQYLRR